MFSASISDDPVLTLSLNTTNNTKDNTKTKGKEIAVDMRRHLKRWLTNSALQGWEGRTRASSWMLSRRRCGIVSKRNTS